MSEDRNPSPGGPGWIEYACLRCDARTRFSIEDGIVVNIHSARLGLPCPSCSHVQLIDHVQYPHNVEAVEQREKRLRSAAVGCCWMTELEKERCN